MSDQIEQAIVTFMSKFCHESITNIEQLSDGMAFNNVLKSLNIKVPPTCDSATWRWPDRLNHLSKLSTLIDERARESGKRISQSDIDLIELCKDYSQNHIISFFQVIVALFIDSPLKEHYVETIMSLDQASQQSFVGIVQDSLARVEEWNQLTHKDDHADKQISRLKHLLWRMSNEINLLLAGQEAQQSQINRLSEQIEQYQAEIELLRTESLGINYHDGDPFMDHNESLKQKLYSMVADHEHELYRLREENLHLHQKLIKQQEKEEQLREKLKQMTLEQQKEQLWRKEKRRLMKVVQEKDIVIDRLKEKVGTTTLKNIELQEIEFEARMKLEQKRVRNQHEKDQASFVEVGSRSTIEQQLISPSQTEEIQYMQQELNLVRKHLHEIERENCKMRKKLEQVPALETTKSKLEKVILQVNKAKDCEIEMLVMSLWELREQNKLLRQAGKLENGNKAV